MSAQHTGTTRRTIVGTLLALASGTAATMLAPVRAFARTVRVRRRWGMTIDLDLCTGCGACVVACKSENNVPLTGRGRENEGTAINWMELLPTEEELRNGEVPMQLLPMPCMHCDDPPCVKVCPVNATYKDDEGLVVQVWDRCIGCRYCQVACPYSRRYFNWKAPEHPDSYLQMLNPDVATRPEGVVEKCTFCQHRLRQKKEEVRREGRELVDADVRKLTACAQSCPAEAIVFGDLEEPDSLVGRLSKSPRATRLLEHLGTDPKVFYLARDRQDS